VRGCGDILSNKLTFQRKAENGEKDTQLNVLLSKHVACDLYGTDGDKVLQQVIDGLRESQQWLRQQPIEALIGLIGEASQRWMKEEKYRFLKDKGLLFLSTWCSADHLQKIAEFGLRGNIAYADAFLPFPTSDKHLLKANGRGLVCHWMAGNVQILGLFALVQCIMTKNVNLLKVSAKDEGVFTTLLSAFEGLTYTTADGYTISGDDLLKTIAVVYFSRHAVGLGEQMSKAADVRIAWGGREAVETVAGYPSRFDSETVIFGPKLSFAVIGKEELQDEQEVRKLARRMAVDVSVFDQTGCASPHNLFIERGGVVSPEQFCTLLDEAMRKTEIQIPKPAMSAEQVSAIHSIRGVYNFKGQVLGSPTMSYTILLDNQAELDKPIYSRVLFVHNVDSVDEALPFVTEDIQTIGIALSFERACTFAEQATMRGAARFPQIGRMLNFEMPWDGIVLIDRLVKWNTVLGPLC